MDELTFLLILAGIGVILLLAMFTYYKHHKKINDEIKDFNHHAHDIDDVLLADEGHHEFHSDDNLPDSFSASRQDEIDIDEIQFHQDLNKKAPDSVSTTVYEPLINNTDIAPEKNDNHNIYFESTTPENIAPDKNAPENTAPDKNERELVDGVYIHSKRVISSTPAPPDKVPEPVFAAKTQTTFIAQTTKTPQTQTIKVVYDAIPDGVNELIISHTILSRGEYFTGHQLYQALETAGLSFGEMHIYHYPGSEDNETFALFSVANIIEPGTFDPQQPEALKTPGISMFMRLPTRIGSNEAYEEFIHIAQLIAADLDGELCDESRSQLTQQAISYKKEQIRKLNFDMAKAKKLAGTSP